MLCSNGCCEHTYMETRAIGIRSHDNILLYATAVPCQDAGSMRHSAHKQHNSHCQGNHCRHISWLSHCCSSQKEARQPGDRESLVCVRVCTWGERETDKARSMFWQPRYLHHVRRVYVWPSYLIHPQWGCGLGGSSCSAPAGSCSPLGSSGTRATRSAPHPQFHTAAGNKHKHTHVRCQPIVRNKGQSNQ